MIDFPMKLESQTPTLPLVPRIPSNLGPRPIQLTSLRPGCWLEEPSSNPSVAWHYVVLQNWPSLRRVEMWDVLLRGYKVFGYDDRVFQCVTFIGHGKRRWWHHYLPAWAKDRVCQYAKP